MISYPRFTSATRTDVRTDTEGFSTCGIRALRRFWRVIPRFDREYTAADLLHALAAIPTTRGSGIDAIERWFAPGSVYFARSGRECLYLLLRLVPLRPNAHIGVPLYCCMAVFEAIIAAGHRPVFLDIDLDTYSLSQDSLSRAAGRLDALVVVHTFGYPADIESIRAALGGRPIPIIEDCAHSLFSKYKGRLTGILTEASFFSFGKHKPAATGSGGMLVINDSRLADLARHKLNGLPAASTRTEITQALKSWATSAAYSRFCYGLLHAFRVLERHDRPFDDGHPAPSSVARFARVPRSVLSVTSTLMEGRFRTFQHQIDRLAENAAKLRRLLADTDLIIPPEPSWGTWNHFLWPIRYRSPEQRTAAREFLGRHGIDTSLVFQNCAYHARQLGYTSGCPAAETAARTVCTVPHHASLTDDELLYVGEHVRRSSGRVQSAAT